MLLTNYFYRYVREILAGTPSSTDQVEIEPNGVWIPPPSSFNTVKTRAPSDVASLILDDDEPVLSGFSPPKSLVSMSSPSMSTPSHLSSHMTSSVNSFSRMITPRSSTPQPAAGQKRPVAEVVDLTLSDDDEPAPKRKNARPDAGHYAGLNGPRDPTGWWS